jgi:F-type H+-transporting ATPase subunit epsilon
MKLRITTPLEVLLDLDGVTALRAEDASGGFGVLPRHADFLTSLAISVVSWETKGGARRYCATRRGVFRVDAGENISIATREAVLGDDLATLRDVALARFRADVETERAERVNSTQLELSAIRQIISRLRGGKKRA